VAECLLAEAGLGRILLSAAQLGGLLHTEEISKSVDLTVQFPPLI
jgi:hypothetical protein